MNEESQVTKARVVVSVMVPERKKGLFGISAATVKLPEPEPCKHIYIAARQPDGAYELRPWEGNESKTAAQLNDGQFICSVFVEKCRLAPQFAEVLDDHQGYSWDFQIEGHFSVADSERFLTSFALDIVSQDAPVTSDIVESWVVNRVSPRVRDVHRNYSIADLKEQAALPPTWWEKQLDKWLKDYGLVLKVVNALWTSAEAEVASAEAARRRELERLTDAKNRQREAELNETRAKAAYEKKKKQIEDDLKLSEKDRGHKLQLLEKQRCREVLEADEAIEEARRNSAKAALEHEATMARLYQDIKAVKTIEERGRLEQEKHEALVAEITNLKSELEKLDDLPGNLLAQLADKNVSRANDAAERLISPEFGFKTASLAGLGFHVARQGFMERLRLKAESDDEKVSIHKTDFVTRDIGTAKVKALPVNTSLEFKVVTDQSGYATLMNIGTSGAVYVHVPSAFVPPEQATVEEGQILRIPGPELLPWERLRQLGLDYVEGGPPGWEHIAVIITETPLISPRIMARSDPQMPFVKLKNREIEKIYTRLDTARPDSWTAGVLSFLVE